MMIELNAGFLPLTDSAVLIAAHVCGFAEEYGIALSLNRETSWANIRDRLCVGQFDLAHALAPMPIAANLGLTPFDTKLIAPMALGLGGNAITIRSELAKQIQKEWDLNPLDAKTAGQAFAQLVKQRAASGCKALKFAVVHPHSGHNLELRYWLAASNIKLDSEVEIVILPPQLMSDGLASGQIDGFCVGEPWNSVAVHQGLGTLLTTKSSIWQSSPEKVLTMRESWAMDNDETVQALLKALYAAAIWCSDTANHKQLAQILSDDIYIGQKQDTIMAAFDGSIVGSNYSSADYRFFDTYARAATFPWQSHALWFYSQMVRWGQVDHSVAHISIARQSYRPDIYRRAVTALGAPVPNANAKVEGGLTQTIPVGVSTDALYLGPDGFFDGMVFDPDRIDTYIAEQVSA